MIDEIYHLQEENLRSKKIQFQKIIEDNIEVFADYEMIQVVIRNLVSNAIKFTPDGGSIILKVSGNGNMANISVIDTGTGIPDEIKRDLFKMDKTITEQGTSGERGTGIGLLLCKDFVEKNKGQISVESILGKGSEFRFTLPLKKSSN